VRHRSEWTGLGSAVAVTGVLAILAACSSSSTSPDTQGADGATPGDDSSVLDAGGGAPRDATLTDGPANAPADAGSEAAPADASDGGAANDSGPTDASDAGTGDGGDGGITMQQLVTAPDAVVTGWTADNRVVYFDVTGQTYYAKALDGSDPVAIYTIPATLQPGWYDSVFGNVVLAWGWDANYLGTLVSWAPGMAHPVTLTTSGLAYRYQTLWGSADSAHVAYLVSNQPGTPFYGVGTLYGANPDGTGTTALVTNADISAADSTCFPHLVFRGAYAVVAYCAIDADAGTSTPMLKAFAPANGWAQAAVVAGAVLTPQFNVVDRSTFTFPFEVDPDGGRMATASTASSGGALQIFPLDGGAGTVVDPSDPLTPQLRFTGTPTNPWNILYNTDAGALKQAYADNPSPQTLVDGGVNYLDGVSHDGKWLLVSSVAKGGWFSDISLVSAQNPGVPVLIASSAEFDGGPVAPLAAGYGGDRGFTADDSYALSTVNLRQNSAGTWLGRLVAVPVAAPNTPAIVSSGAVFGYQPLRGTKVFVADNAGGGDGGSPYEAVDYEIVDVGGGATTNIVRGVNADGVMSGDLSHLAYSVYGAGAGGIYVATLPGL
jgi:hypothetical protein